MNAAEKARLAATALGHDFSNPDLLAEALTHPSARSGRLSYERFEFLGDRVLGLIVAGMLLEAFPAEDEGALAKRLAALVRRESLAEIADRLGVGAFVEISRGEEESGGRANPTLLADALEAMIAALYLDAGLAAAESFVRCHWTAMMEAMDTPPQDAKTRLQEWAQGAGMPLPVYTTTGEEGPAHEPEFDVAVSVEGEAPARGRGRSKRVAEQAAAAALLARVGLR